MIETGLHHIESPSRLTRSIGNRSRTPLSPRARDHGSIARGSERARTRLPATFWVCRGPPGGCQPMSRASGGTDKWLPTDAQDPGSRHQSVITDAASLPRGRKSVADRWRRPWQATVRDARSLASPSLAAAGGSVALARPWQGCGSGFVDLAAPARLIVRGLSPRHPLVARLTSRRVARDARCRAGRLADPRAEPTPAIAQTAANVLNP